MLAFVESLGCAPNQADSNAVRSMLLSIGCELTNEASAAALVVIFTCGFTAQMEGHNRSRLNQLVSDMQSGARLFVGGCLPGITSGRLGLPSTTFLFGPRTIRDALFEMRTYAGSVATAEAAAVGALTGCGKPHLVRIETGCMSRCAFCAIPMAAGATQSRPIADVVAEVAALEARGADRVLLTGEDASSYGRDIGQSYVTLLHAVIQGTKQVQLGIDTLNPKWLRGSIDEFLEVLRNERVARTIYIPIQSGSDRILKAMRRGYSVADVRSILTKLARLDPMPQIITDFIVGFPGETEVDFAETRTMLQAYPFHFVEVFAYTERAGTSAATLPGIPEDVRKSRTQTLVRDILRMKNGLNSPVPGIHPVINTNVDFQLEQVNAQ